MSARHVPGGRPRIVVLGDAVLDVAATPVRPAVRDGDTPALIRVGPGGQGANVAVRLARRGVPVRLVCGLADDAAGTLLRAALVAEGIELDAVPVDATGSVVVLAEGGARTMLSARSAFTPLAVPAVGAVMADWLVVSGYLLLEPGADALAEALAASHGRRALLGCALRPDEAAAWTRGAARARPDVVILNADEAATVAGDAGDVAERLACLAVVTRPGGAAAHATAGWSASVQAERGRAVVDTTGAGDAFAAALIERLAGGPWPPDADRLADALAEAARLATAVTGVPGAQGRVAGERGPATSAGDTLPA